MPKSGGAKGADDVRTQLAYDPLTSKGEKILESMRKTYGPRAENVLYASAKKGTITGIHDKLTRVLGTDPPTSEAQRRAMFAAKEGHSNLGIPQSVGKEFAEADPGGKLPARARDMAGSEFRLLRWLLTKFFQEEAAESEHQEQDQQPAGEVFHVEPGEIEEGEKIYGPMWGCWDAPPDKRGAGVIFVTDDGRALFLKRGGAGDHQGEWCFPGGRAEGDENQLQTARREATEETGHTCPICGVKCPADDMRIVDHSRSHDGHHYTTFGHYTKDAFEPKINAEHTEAVWAPISRPPEPLHPAVKATLDKAQKLLGDRLVFEPSDVYGRRFASDQRLAMDRAATRTYDDAGRLHVDEANISKATVNPYFGREINEVMRDTPGWKMLDPETKYNLLRHPDELAKAASTFNGLPVLFKHKPTSAEDHPTEITVGATGNDAEFEYPYLKNSLVIWPKYATEAVEDGEQKQLSCGYSYTADMTPGVFEGMSYDGIMRNLVGNHVALVHEGRAGPDVMIGDEAISQWEVIAAAVRSINSRQLAA